MKNLIQYITISILLLLAFSCNNDFLKDSPEDNIASESSTIIISPNWEATDYNIYCQGIGNAKFTIVQAPGWLNISTRSGQFSNNIATLHCKASVHKDFSETGMYHTFLTLSIEGKDNLAIPIVYITEGNPVIETSSHLTINYNSFNAALSIKNTGKGILTWDILELPQWLSLNENMSYRSPHVLPEDGEGTVYLSYNSDIPYQANLSSQLVIISNDKNHPVVEVEVQMDLGEPALYCYSGFSLDFGRTETTHTFEFSNQGNGMLVWKIEECPEWLSVSKTSGYLSPYSGENLTFTCNRDLLPSGLNTVTVYLNTNDKQNPSFPITVTARNNTANPENVKAIEGNITDAWLDKKTDILYLTTAQPNRLLAYDIQNKTVARALSLSYAPTCFSVSEDGQKTVIGHSGYITSIDMDNFSVIKTMEINHIVYDIEWGKGDWCCYSVPNVQWTYLYWVNLNTSETVYSDQIYESCRLRKIPNQDYIIGAELMVSAGVHVFDINTRKKEYSNFTFIGNFYFSENGLYMYSGASPGFSIGGNIYRTSSFFINDYAYDVSPIGKFTPAPHRSYWIDHHAASHSVWIVSSSSDYYYDEQREIIQYEDNDYTRKATYYYDDYYNNRFVQAHYVFANNAGTELVVIRNATNGNEWSLEFIPVTK